MLPWVRSVLIKVQRILKDLDQPPAEKLFGESEEAAAPVHKANGNGQRSKAKAEVVEVEALWQDLTRDQKIELANGLVETLVDEGIVIQDIRRGLIDFPGWRGGEEILLCYELKDGPRITHWHSLTEGFAGRRPIDDLID